MPTWETFKSIGMVQVSTTIFNYVLVLPAIITRARRHFHKRINEQGLWWKGQHNTNNKCPHGSEHKIRSCSKYSEYSRRTIQPSLSQCIKSNAESRRALNVGRLKLLLSFGKKYLRYILSNVFSQSAYFF